MEILNEEEQKLGYFFQFI